MSSIFRALGFAMRGIAKDRGLWSVLFVALLVRSAVQWGAGESLKADPDSYALLAENLTAEGVFGFCDPQPRATAFRPILYPWLLSFFVAQNGDLALGAVAIMHVFVGVLTVGFSYAVARRLNVWPWLAASAVAVDPVLLRQSQLVMTETLATLWAIAIWWLWLSLVRKNHHTPSPLLTLLLGVGFGAAILLRPTAAPWFLLCLAAFPLLYRRESNRFGVESTPATSIFVKQVSGILMLILGVGCCLGPWILRNYQQLQRPIWATSHGGYTLLLANNPLIYEHFRSNGFARNWDAEPFHSLWGRRAEMQLSPSELSYWETDIAQDSLEPALQVGFPEIEDNQIAYEAAHATILREPDMFLQSCLYRAAWLWALWPHEASFVQKLLIGCWYAVWFWLNIVGFCRIFLPRSRHEWELGLGQWMPGILLVVALTIVHAVYWSNMRMRAPMMPVIYIMASLGLSRGWFASWWREKLHGRVFLLRSSPSDPFDSPDQALASIRK